MANALILNKSRYALLIHNIKNGQNRFEFPGGKVKENENLEESVIREVEEELGIKIKVRKVGGRKIFGDYPTETPEGEFLCRTYHAEIISGEPEIMEKDKADYWDYFSYDSLLNLNKKKILALNLVLSLTKLMEYME